MDSHDWEVCMLDALALHKAIHVARVYTRGRLDDGAVRGENRVSTSTPTARRGCVSAPPSEMRASNGKENVDDSPGLLAPPRDVPAPQAYTSTTERSMEAASPRVMMRPKVAPLPLASSVRATQGASRHLAELLRMRGPAVASMIMSKRNQGQELEANLSIALVAERVKEGGSTRMTSGAVRSAEVDAGRIAKAPLLSIPLDSIPSRALPVAAFRIRMGWVAPQAHKSACRAAIGSAAGASAARTDTHPEGMRDDQPVGFSPPTVPFPPPSPPTIPGHARRGPGHVMTIEIWARRGTRQFEGTRRAAGGRSLSIAGGRRWNVRGHDGGPNDVHTRLPPSKCEWGGNWRGVMSISKDPRVSGTSLATWPLAGWGFSSAPRSTRIFAFKTSPTCP
ncbi:hypothetical protein C8F04DRAFT_1185563 [Mycena alexandri]|uniref:Uncharacterized protein n=1 Tax=Mycena alexandri TaxID=1745969 RepID=A0AAD6SSS6_9AGAR|nr:hypothetical protein C8F04DRAFT_1185563 [Mycena alexandri]